MKVQSIRGRLLAWLLAGQGLLFLVLGISAYLGVRHYLIAKMDDELKQASRLIKFRTETLPTSRSLLRKQSKPRENSRWQKFDAETGSFYFQLKKDGQITMKSQSLGERQLPFRENVPSLPWHENIETPDGKKLRVRYAMSSLGKRTGSVLNSSPDLMVAQDFSTVHATLSKTLGTILATSMIVAISTIMLVTILLRRTLAPLRKLGEDAAQMSADNLTNRFSQKAMPDELRPICQKLNDLMGRLETSFERERRFSADLAHEMRTPLAELSAISEAASLFPKNVSDETFDDIQATVKQMESVVESLQALARWDRKDINLSSVEMPLSEAVSDHWKSYASQAESKKLNVEIIISPDQTIHTDPDLFRHILTNLFSNAVDYTPEEGRIEIQGSGSTLTIRNSASQLAPEEIPHLFERFWRHSSSRSSENHCGLGLSLAQACAKALSLELTPSLENNMLEIRVDFPEIDVM